LTQNRHCDAQIENLVDQVDENLVLEAVQDLINGEGKVQVQRKLKLKGLGQKNTALIIKAAESVLILSAKEDLEYIKGKLLNQAEEVFRSAMQSVNLKTGQRDHGSAVKALTLVMKLSGAAAPQQINVQHNVEYHLEQLSDSDLLKIAEGRATLEEVLHPPQLPQHVIEGHFEEENQITSLVTPIIPVIPDDDRRHRRNR
jgi:hypothetical protein